MNLGDSPTEAQLAALLASCNDEKDHHVLWVDRSGSVHISPLPEEVTPVGFQKRTPSMQFRYETFQQGNGYVGLKASRDSGYVARLFKSLQRDWGLYEGAPSTPYIDVF